MHEALERSPAFRCSASSAGFARAIESRGEVSEGGRSPPPSSLGMLLTVVTFLPALGALLVLLLPRDRPLLAKRTSFGVTAATFLASVPLFFGFNAASAGYQFVERRA